MYRRGMKENNPFGIPDEEWDAVCAEIKARDIRLEFDKLEHKLFVAQTWSVKQILKLRNHKHAPPLELMRFR